MKDEIKQKQESKKLDIFNKEIMNADLLKNRITEESLKIYNELMKNIDKSQSQIIENSNESQNTSIENTSETNCLALTVRKDYNISILKNSIVKTFKLSYKVLISAFFLNLLRLFF